MELSKEVLKIDPSKVADKITDFIKENMKDQGRSGILIPISGGLDSSVIASLCARAVGKDKVIGLMLPEKHGNPEAEKYGKILADFLGIKTEMIDISRILKDLGAYDFLLSCVPTYRLKGLVVKAYSLIHGANPFAESVKRTDNKYLLKIEGT